MLNPVLTFYPQSGALVLAWILSQAHPLTSYLCEPADAPFLPPITIPYPRIIEAQLQCRDASCITFLRSRMGGSGAL